MVAGALGAWGVGGGKEQGRPDRAEQHDEGDVGHEQGHADQPHPADRGEREHRGVLPLGGAVQVPRAAEPLVGAHPLRDQPAARDHDERGEQPPPRCTGPQELMNRDGERGPHPPHYRAEQHKTRPDLRCHPVQHRDQVPGPEPPAPRDRFPSRGGTREQHHPRHQREPRQVRQRRSGEHQNDRHPAREERQPPHRIPELPDELATQPHISIVRRHASVPLHAHRLRERCAHALEEASSRARRTSTRARCSR